VPAEYVAMDDALGGHRGRDGRASKNRLLMNNIPVSRGSLARMGRSGAVFPQTAFWSIFKNRRIPTFSMGDYPRRGWNSINSHGLCGRKAMDCEIRDFSRENSRGFRNSLTSPGRKQPAWRFRLGLPSVPKRGQSPCTGDATAKRQHGGCNTEDWDD
jgi:hypothetical protein